MGKTWATRRRGDEQDFLRWLAKGKTVYVINEQAHLVPGVARARTYTSHTVTGKHPILGGWIFDGSPSNPAKEFFQWAGTVYENPPKGFEHINDQMHEPVDARYFKGAIHVDDIKEMEYEADLAADRTIDARRTGARRFW
ncbi:hypothetical protein [Streptomyces lavendulae]|uniref:hypothetical protein n=1 Tax=Streptomyces lavendulae TaxID=1914 RepID=UPI0031EA278E